MKTTSILLLLFLFGCGGMAPEPEIQTQEQALVDGHEHGRRHGPTIILGRSEIAVFTTYRVDLGRGHEWVLKMTEWHDGANFSNEFFGFDFSTNLPVVYQVSTGDRTFYGRTSPWLNPVGLDGPVAKGITGIQFWLKDRDENQR